MRSRRTEQEEALIESVRRLYGTPISLEVYSAKSRHGGLDAPERAIVERFLSPPATVLVVGCGTGREAFDLTRMGFTVTGVDITPAAIETARKIASELDLMVDFHIGDGTSLAFPDRSFRYVWLVNVLHHIPGKENRRCLLREAGRVVEPQGRILLTHFDWDIVEDYFPPGSKYDRRLYEARADELPETLKPVEPRDRFVRDYPKSKVFAYHHDFTRAEMEEEVNGAGLRILRRASFSIDDIAGGEPDPGRKPRQALVLSAPSRN